MARHLGQEALNFSDFYRFRHGEIGETNHVEKAEIRLTGGGMNGAQGQI